MTTIFKTEVEAFVVLYARCNDIAELLSDEAHSVKQVAALPAKQLQSMSAVFDSTFNILAH